MKRYIFISILVLLGQYSLAQNSGSISADLNGQVVFWAVQNFNKPNNTQLGGRFIPEFRSRFNLDDNSYWDTEISAHLHATFNLKNGKNSDNALSLSPYRLWFRYSSENWEVRTGLQKINFGTAKIFRPEMWFDRMDIRDPLRLTSGVYAVLGKYFFSNSVNVSLWWLIGNDQPKGWELVGTQRWTPELGGRVQTPLGNGEIAFSTHFRKANTANILPTAPTRYNEFRIGSDGVWDVGVGFWYEISSTISPKNSIGIPQHTLLMTVGADYTLGIGNGLGVTAEHLMMYAGNHFLPQKNEKTVQFSALQMTYPLSILDNLSATIFWQSNDNQFFNYFNVVRTYDHWRFYIIAFWNPEIDLPIYATTSNGNSIFSGKGIQLMTSYHF